VVGDYRARLVAAARKHGKQVAFLADSVEACRQMIELGATIITYSSEAAVLRAAYSGALAEIRKTH
jgi:2-keto-3-deoxy-L-rhamnonate aldolase RhmA